LYMEKAATAEAGEVRRRCAGHERSRSASATVPFISHERRGVLAFHFPWERQSLPSRRSQSVPDPLRSPSPSGMRSSGRDDNAWGGQMPSGLRLQRSFVGRPSLRGPRLLSMTGGTYVGSLGTTQDYLVAVCGIRMAFSSLPRKARGKSMALNSAPTRITSEIMYIQTSRAMATPREP
jgi:hypothetical protein